MITGLASCHFSVSEKHKQVIVFCAASLTDVLTGLKSAFEESNNADIKLNLASSGTLARQIEQGAPADIFLSANHRWMDYLKSKDLTEDSSISQVAGNSLVIVVPASSQSDTIIFNKEFSFPGYFKGRLSIGDPDYVPAGAYAREALENLGCYKQLQNRLLPAKDVRAALLVVELGEAEAGIVYKTDALKSKKVRIVATIPDSLHQRIEYYCAVIKGHANDKTLNFYNFIMSEQAKLVWARYGFNLQ